MTGFNFHMLDESKAAPWERHEVLDENTGEPTGELYESRFVPATNVGGGDHVLVLGGTFQTRSVGAARTLEDWRLQQTDKADKPAASPWFGSATVDDDGNENGWLGRRLVLTAAGDYTAETRFTPASAAA